MIFCGIPLESRALLAPMAGAADSPYRRMARRYGAALVYTELISADGIIRDNEKTRRLYTGLEAERPLGIQLFGNEPGVMAEAARMVNEEKPDLVDLNFGCPVRKVVKRQAGCALMKDLHRMEAIARAVTGSSEAPVTAKIRSGWDRDSMNAVEAALRLQDAGVRAVAVHARTQKMGFSGEADWSVIGAVRHAVEIPVIGNGDIQTPNDALRMRRDTGCDLVMVGRGAMGRPWLFRQIGQALETGEWDPDPDFETRIAMCMEHYRLALTLSDHRRAVREMRKHVGWYTRGMPGAGRLRQAVFHMETADEVLNTLQEYAGILRSRSGDCHPVE